MRVTAIYILYYDYFRRVNFAFTAKTVAYAENYI